VLDADQYASVLSAVDTGVAIVRDGRVQYANQYVSDLLGYPETELRGSRLTEFVAVGHEPTARRQCRPNDDPETTRVREVTVIRSDGERVPTELRRSATEFDEKPAVVLTLRELPSRRDETTKTPGETTGTLGDATETVEQTIGRDHSDRHRQSCAQSADCRSDIIEYAPVGVLRVDEQLRVVYQNPRAEEIVSLLGDDPMSEAGDDVRELGAFAETAASETFDRLTDGERVSFDSDVETSEDGVRHLHGRGVPLFVDGTLDGAVLFVRDVTEKQRRELKLERFREAVEQTGHAVFITDTDGTIEYVNPAFEELTGYTSQAALGNTPRILKSGEHDAEYYERLWQTILGGDTWDECVVNRRKSGERYTAEQTIAPIHNDGLSGFVAIQSETTVEQVQQQRLSVLNRLLRHNLRTAVNVIWGHAEMLQRGVDDPEYQSHAESIIEKTRELVQLREKTHTIEEALEHAGEETGSRLVTELLTDVLESAAFDREAVVVSVDYPPETITVTRDIRPALEELVENAVSHNDQSQPSLEVAVSLHNSGGQVRIEISDDGPGIPQPTREALQQMEETPLRHTDGLGLWFVKWLTTAVGGKMHIDEPDGYGSTVTVSLPVVETVDHDPVSRSSMESV
jgi:PAS domain S-box-containing protein